MNVSCFFALIHKIHIEMAGDVKVIPTKSLKTVKFHSLCSFYIMIKIIFKFALLNIIGLVLPICDWRCKWNCNIWNQQFGVISAYPKTNEWRRIIINIQCSSQSVIVNANKVVFWKRIFRCLWFGNPRRMDSAIINGMSKHFFPR